MSKLLGMSFDAAASPEITLLYTRLERMERDRPFGWGMAWYASSDRAATVVKDPGATSDSASTRLLRDWTRFRSATFICHLRGAAARISQENTHPFSRSHAGRDWVLTHHGQLRPGFKTALGLGDRPAFAPVGLTDSEHMLCWLLHRCRNDGLTRLAEIGWPRLRAWLSEANVLGTMNLLVSDGSELVAYRDRGSHTPLFWTRRCPPQEKTVLSNEDIEVDLGGVRDRARTAVLITTDRLSSGEADTAEWHEMMPGQVIVVSRGFVVWDSHAGQLENMVQPSSIVALGSATELASPSVQIGAAQVPGFVQPVHGQSNNPVLTNPSSQASPSHGSSTAPVGHLDPPIAQEPAMQMTDANGASGALPPQPALGADAAAPQPMRAPSTQGFRIYDILHATRYAYGSPVEFSRHVLRLRPIDDRFQQVLSHELLINPSCVPQEHEDVFGNFASRIEIEGSAANIEFIARSRVRVHTARAGDLRSAHRRNTIPLSWMPWQRQMMLPYLLPMELPEPQLQELFDYAMSFVERQDYDLVETLLDINTSIYRDYSYVQGVTSVETTPFEVYSTRRGVCQDFANLLICLARLLNVPARYRVGYIYTGGNYENKVQSDASHAWVEVFLPWVGWKGLDPTNGIVVSDDHIRVASGRHYRDATPTSGTIYRGGGEEKLSIEVRVEPVDENV